MTSIPEQDIRAEVERITASKGFASAARITKLLRYVVDKTLAGETDQLKEYSVGVEVFDRDSSYDPRIDSIVRVEAGRLRTRLDEYYNGEGAASPIRISLPRGGYVAAFGPAEAGPSQFSKAASSDQLLKSGEGLVFKRSDGPVFEPSDGPVFKPSEGPVKPSEGPASAGPQSRLISVLLAAALLVAVGGMVFWLVSRDRSTKEDLRPTAAVLPVEANMIGGDNDNYSAQFTEALTSELARLGPISVASFTSSMQFAGRRYSMKEAASALNSHYIVEASIDDEASEILVVARIVNAQTDRKMWVSDYRGARDDVRGVAQRIAFDISAAILEREATRTR